MIKCLKQLYKMARLIFAEVSQIQMPQILLTSTKNSKSSYLDLLLICFLPNNQQSVMCKN